MDTWAPDRGVTTVENVFTVMADWMPSAEGLTVTGGEPFEQPEALAELLRIWREAHCGDVIVFSGYSLEVLADRLVRLEGLIDALVADPFNRHAPQTLALRGSDNQRLVALTRRGAQLVQQYERPLGPNDLTLDFMSDNRSGSVFLAGIPRRGDLNRLAGLLATSGHVAVTSEDKR